MVSVTSLLVNLRYDLHIYAICKSCNFHLYRLSSIRRYLTVEATRNAVQALIKSRLDYCNSLLAAMTSAQVNQLPKMQNKAAHDSTASSHHTSTRITSLAACGVPYSIQGDSDGVQVSTQRSSIVSV